MSRYIDREQALSHPFANGLYDHKHANEHYIFGFEDYKEWLEQLPIADVVEVVRCKDCKHRDKYECNNLTFGDIKCGVPDDWFCADGERKEGGS